jgi:hypothetical protein
VCCDEQEFFAIHELKVHVDFVPVHGAIKHDLPLRGLLKSEISLQVFGLRVRLARAICLSG